jgi:hypothetical protein
MEKQNAAEVSERIAYLIGDFIKTNGFKPSVLMLGKNEHAAIMKYAKDVTGMKVEYKTLKLYAGLQVEIYNIGSGIMVTV